jgi:hypothetical protein
MPVYRTYFLDARERVRRMVEIEAADDSAALTLANVRGPSDAAAEVWLGDQLIGRIGAEFNLHPAA